MLFGPVVEGMAVGDAEELGGASIHTTKSSIADKAYDNDVETLEQVLPRIRKLFVDKNGNLDLTILRKGDPAAK